MAKKRTKLEILEAVLNVVYQNRKIKPTHLLYKANLSYVKMNEYLEFLISNGFILESGKEYEITEKGIKKLTELKKFKEFSESFGI